MLKIKSTPRTKRITQNIDVATFDNTAFSGVEARYISNQSFNNLPIGLSVMYFVVFYTSCLTIHVQCLVHAFYPYLYDSYFRTETTLKSSVKDH